MSYSASPEREDKGAVPALSAEPASGLDNLGLDNDVEDSGSQLRVDACLEQICQQGCREVGRLLGLMDQGVLLTEVANLSSAERQQVHAELRSVMDVYGGGCCEIG